MWKNIVYMASRGTPNRGASGITVTNGIVYVLPETRSARTVFASYDVEAHGLLLSQK